MKVELTKEQIKNVLILISRAETKGEEAMGVVFLQQLFNVALQKFDTQPKEKKTDKPKEKV